MSKLSFYKEKINLVIDSALMHLNSDRDDVVVYELGDEVIDSVSGIYRRNSVKKLLRRRYRL